MFGYVIIILQGYVCALIEKSKYRNVPNLTYTREQQIQTWK